MKASITAAIPVAVMFGLALATIAPQNATTVGVGAMLTGMSWRGIQARPTPPVGTMFASAIALSVVTLFGTLSENISWLHLSIMFLICMSAGAIMVIGRHGVIVGYRAVIGYIVFGIIHIHGSGDALAQAGYVLAGGFGQAFFAMVMASPMSWKRERKAVSDAYHEIADMALSPIEISHHTAVLLDEAESVLGTPALFASPARPQLEDLTAEGRRLRLGLLVLYPTISREFAGLDDREQLEALVTEVRERLNALIAKIGDAVLGDPDSVETLPAMAQSFENWSQTRTPVRKHRVEDRLAAVIGQANAAARLALSVGLPEDHGFVLRFGGDRKLIIGRPMHGSRSLKRVISSDVRKVRENVTLNSMTGRHALRLATAVTATAILVDHVNFLPRSYWAVLTVALVLKPDFAATYIRVFERTIGTTIGVVGATLIAAVMKPGDVELVILVAICAFGCYMMFTAHFMTGIASLSGMVVFLMHGIDPDTAQTAWQRGVDTLAGGLIGVLAFTVWPSWSGSSLHRLLARLSIAQREYFDAITTALVGGKALADADVQRLGRASRVAWTDARSAIELAQGEPQRTSLDAHSAAAVLAALRRVIWSVHGLRLEVFAIEHPQPYTELEALRASLLEALTKLATTLERMDPGAAEMPALRRVYNDVQWPDDRGFPRPARAQFDEMVDAVDTAASTLHIALPVEFDSADPAAAAAV